MGYGYSKRLLNYFAKLAPVYYFRFWLLSFLLSKNVQDGVFVLGMCSLLYITPYFKSYIET